MIEYIISFVISAVQIAEFICFCGIFFDHADRRREIICAAVLNVTAYAILNQLIFLLGKSRGIPHVLSMILLYLVYVIVVYRTRLNIGLFVAISGYSFLLFADYTIAGLLPLEYVSEWKDIYAVIVLGAYIPVFVLLIVLRHYLERLKSYVGKCPSMWLGFGWIPLVICIFGVYFFDRTEREGRLGFIYTVLGMVIMILSIAYLFLLQEILVREDEISRSRVREKKNQNQLQAFYDMQSLFKRQSNKLHDYRKQLGALRELVQKGDTETAVDFIDNLTESISVEISEVNVGHPVINAVLNQNYRVAKSKNIAISMSIGDLHGVMMESEDIVTMLGNLLENAINECEKITAMGRDAVIGVKFVEKGDGFMLTVRNPVREQVRIKRNKVQTEVTEGHGIGLSNVENVVRKYGGDFAISCDDEEFVAVVMIG